jgi:hypothetical protein
MMAPDIADPGLVTDLGLALQLALGCVFLRSLASKLRRPAGFAEIVDGYRLVPSRAAAWVAGAVMLAEAFVVVSLLGGWLVPAGAGVVLALTAAFAIGTTINLRRGRAIDCGCFGEEEKISPRSVQRLGLVGAGAVLLTAGVASSEVGSLGDAVDQGLLDGAAYLIATLGISAFLLVAATLALEGRSTPRAEGRSEA